MISRARTASPPTASPAADVRVDGRPSRFWSAPNCGVAILTGGLDPLGDD
ncbi:hypothetical protein ABT369_22145 [Dactylosporangium sp. NPDC000244]